LVYQVSGFQLFLYGESSYQIIFAFDRVENCQNNN